MTIGAYLLSMIDASTNGWVLAGYMFVFGVGMGLIMQVLVVAVQNAVSYEDLGVATSSATFFRMIGGSFGTAVFGAIYAIVLNHTIAPTLAKVPASVLKKFNPQTINPSVLGPAEIDRRGAVLLHEVHRRRHPCHPDRLPGGGADRLRGLPPELAPARGASCARRSRPSTWARSTGCPTRGRRCRRSSWRSTRLSDRENRVELYQTLAHRAGHRPAAPGLLAALPLGRSAGLHGQRRGQAAEGGRRPDPARCGRVAGGRHDRGAPPGRRVRPLPHGGRHGRPRQADRGSARRA